VAAPRVVDRDGHCVLAGGPERQDVDAVALAGGEGNCLSRGDRLGSAEKLNMGGAVINAPQVGASCLRISLGPPPAPVIARRARLRSSSAQIFAAGASLEGQRRGYAPGVTSPLSYARTTA
jgi:hypothetical protein